MPNVSLTPELEHFTAACVQQVENQQRDFLATLDAAEAEGEREGFLTVDEVMADLDAVIEAAVRARA